MHKSTLKLLYCELNNIDELSALFCIFHIKLENVSKKPQFKKRRNSFVFFSVNKNIKATKWTLSLRIHKSMKLSSISVPFNIRLSHIWVRFLCNEEIYMLWKFSVANFQFTSRFYIF